MRQQWRQNFPPDSGGTGRRRTDGGGYQQAPTVAVNIAEAKPMVKLKAIWNLPFDMFVPWGNGVPVPTVSVPTVDNARCVT